MKALALALVAGFALTACDKPESYPTSNDTEVNTTAADYKHCPDGSVVLKDELCPSNGAQPQ
jgi:putative hemolysin